MKILKLTLLLCYLNFEQVLAQSEETGAATAENQGLTTNKEVVAPAEEKTVPDEVEETP